MRHYDDGESEAAGDSEVDWSQLNEVRVQIATINAIEDDEERLLAAKAWAEELAG